MSYPGFAKPVGLRTVDQWADWAVGNNLWMPINEKLPHACATCRGAVQDATDGTPWRRCYACHGDSLLDAVLPGSYSWHQGLEAAVYWAKNESHYRWLNVPLACLLHRFLNNHQRCIERQSGPIDLITVVPSHSSSREGWDHMKYMTERVKTWSQPWENDLLEKTKGSAAGARRGEVDHDLFEVMAPVYGAHVVIVDDVYTTGGTLRSAAAALKDAGADKVTAVTLGRQIRPEHARSQALVAELQTAQFDITRCAFEGDDDILQAFLDGLI